MGRHPKSAPFDTEVLVIGGGPVGLALAGDIGWQNHQCVLLEQGSGIVGQPRMDGVGVRTMEFCRRWGIVDKVEASGYNRAYPQDNVYLTTLNGYELGRERMPSMMDDQPPPESPQKRERCPQNMFDPILQAFARSQAGVELRYLHQLKSFEQDAHGVISTVTHLETGQDTQIRSRFLVGCDGGRSTVREQLGIGMQGRGVLTHTTNVIFRCPDFNALHDKEPGYRYMFVDERGVWATIVAINGKDEWRMSIVGDEHESRIFSEQELKGFACRALGRTFDMKILSTLRWTRKELVADSYRVGRVFIAGDACHLTSPTGGLGMNTGIGDAVDLSWKLSAYLEGWGGPKLLDSYQIERRPIAHRITRFSSSNLDTMRQVPHSAQVLQSGEVGEAARQTVGQALKEGLRKEWHSKNMHLGNRYLASPVCVYDEPEDLKSQQAEFEDAVNYRPSTRPGVRAPHVWLEPGRSTLDFFGRGFVLVSHAEDALAALPLLQKAGELHIAIRQVVITDQKVKFAYEKRHVLVRPDGHVAWRGARPPVDARGLLARVSGNENHGEPI